MSELLELPSRWLTFRGEVDGLPSVTLVDEPVALAAPCPGFPVQVGVGVHLLHPDRLGQPGLTERPVLKAFEQALVDAAGGQARLVASITLAGVREYVLYARDLSVSECWAGALPPALRTHEFQVEALMDPTWLGLREIAGLLEPGEQPLRPGNVG